MRAVALFREAERRIRTRQPRLRAEPLIALYPHRGQAELLEACCHAAADGLAGVNLLATPYDAETDWMPVRAWASRAAAAGLGIAVHAGGFTTANVAAALSTPGLRRLGHAVHAAGDRSLLDALARAGVAVECPLTCNVVLGAAALGTSGSCLVRPGRRGGADRHPAGDTGRRPPPRGAPKRPPRRTAPPGTAARPGGLVERAGPVRPAFLRKR